MKSTRGARIPKNGLLSAACCDLGDSESGWVNAVSEGRGFEGVRLRQEIAGRVGEAHGNAPGHPSRAEPWPRGGEGEACRLIMASPLIEIGKGASRPLGEHRSDVEIPSNGS
jgi:hypothetical protein